MDKTVGCNTRIKISASPFPLKSRHVLLLCFIFSAAGVQAPLPPSPVNFNVLSVTETMVTLSWDFVDGAEAYRIVSWNENRSTVLSDIYPAYGQKPPITTTIYNLVCLGLPVGSWLHNDDLSSSSPADHRKIRATLRHFRQQGRGFQSHSQPLYPRLPCRCVALRSAPATPPHAQPSLRRLRPSPAPSQRRDALRPGGPGRAVRRTEPRSVRDERGTRPALLRAPAVPGLVAAREHQGRPSQITPPGGRGLHRGGGETTQPLANGPGRALRGARRSRPRAAGASRAVSAPAQGRPTPWARCGRRRRRAPP